MSITIGIDVGGSTTKIVGFRDGEGKRELMTPQLVRATDPMTSVYGAFGKFTDMNGLALSDIKDVKMTGVGSSHITKSIYSLGCEHVSEFTSIGLGGLYLSGLKEAVVVSMGTGTALVYAKEGETPKYLGGTGVGGGTLVGLSKLLLGMDNLSHVQELAKDGDLSRVDLRVKDISKSDIFTGKRNEMTAANFGNISDIASKSDIALGAVNMVFETIAMVSIFASRNYNINDIVLTGFLSSFESCKKIFSELSLMFGVNFIIPENARYGTAIGAALIEK